MRLSYLVWGGKESLFVEAVFSILTFLSDPVVEAVTVLTDKPEMFHLFEPSAKVRVVYIPPGEFTDWYGPSRYVFRAKLKGMERLVELHPGEDLVYVDTDTFRGGDMVVVKEHLAKGRFCMHDFEGRTHESLKRDRRWQRVFNQAKSLNLSGIEIGANPGHWNSGCVGLPGGKAKEMLEKVLRVNDATLAEWWGEGVHFIEEACFSMVLEKAGQIMDVSECVGHYYGNKLLWDRKISDFLAMNRLKCRSLAEDIEAARDFDFKELPISCHIPTWRRRINGHLEKLLPDKRVRYFPERLEMVKSGR